MKPGHTGLKHLIHSTRYSIKGLKAAVVHEAAFRQELLLCLIMVPAAIWLGQTVIERLILIVSCLLILIVELINSAIEAVVDRIGPEYHELSGRAKDLGSAAVLVSLVCTCLVWLSVAAVRFL
ncbi:diacylglycerol kinase [Oceanospirillum sediminis]|uniref:Diacylglycerol kinase n=1 Tax=Oceanospirillum sediminis TaxID=2760088 RepID=A0A839ILI5_9GAMM|nr:diacylglycerol kinase [Oceanospirillum sediminis]MBB1485564.1 diacylglycerol kinase [Oceanospirillum sediminis]